MAPRPPKSDEADPDPLKPKSDNARIDKAKTTKSKAVRVKAEKVEKVPKVAKPKAEKPEKPATTKKVAEKKQEEKKEKVKAVVGEEAEALMVAYLRRENRPFSATEISANLHGKVTKTVADKLLKDLGASNTIEYKATNGDNKGSQFVFWIKQDPADAASPEELAAMEDTIVALREGVPMLKAKAKIVAAKLATIKSAPTVGELAGIVEALKEEHKLKSKKLLEFRERVVKQFSKEDMAQVEKDFRYWTQKRKTRKNGFQNLLDLLLQSGMKTKEDVWDEAGLEEVDESFL